MVSPRCSRPARSSIAWSRAASLCEGLGEQVGEVEHLDVALAQRGGEGVVLVLRAGDPRDAVEEQLVVVARGEPLQLGTGPVQHHGPEPADLGVGAVRCVMRASPQP